MHRFSVAWGHLAHHLDDSPDTVWRIGTSDLPDVTNSVKTVLAGLEQFSPGDVDVSVASALGGRTDAPWVLFMQLGYVPI